MAITREQIIAAAEAIEAAGAYPSAAAVRRRIGYGSYATIGPVLAEWRESRAKGKAETPQSVKDAALRLAEEIWRQAQAQAQAALAAEREALQAERDRAIAERDQAIALAQRLAAALPGGPGS